MAKFYSDLGGTKTTLDILSDALNIGNGIHKYNLNGALYTGNLPELNYAYGNGTVFKRNEASITVVLYGGTQDPIATNYSSDGKTWSGWKVHALKSDLANKTKSGSATISTKQNDSTALQIRFDEPFPSRPYVTVSLNADNANTNTKISVFGIDQTGFKVSIYDTAATTRRIEWIASV